MTLCTDNVGDLVNNRHVSDEISLSDRRYTVFPVDDQAVTRLTYRNRKRTNWESYRADLKVKGYTLNAGGSRPLTWRNRPSFRPGFPVSMSKCWDGTQDAKLPLHASHVAPPDLNLVVNPVYRVSQEERT